MSLASLKIDILTVKEVADVLGVKPRTVYDLAKLGEAEPRNPKGLPFMFRVGGSWRARARDVASWIDDQAASR